MNITNTDATEVMTSVFISSKVEIKKWSLVKWCGWTDVNAINNQQGVTVSIYAKPQRPVLIGWGTAAHAV